MKEKVIEELHDILKNNLCTLKRSSLDDSKQFKFYMSESKITVVNFDRIPNIYSKGKGWKGVPNSNDALYVDDNKWYFIEFKNGEVVKTNVYRKIYDSLIMLIELGIIPDFEFARKNMIYILVYNSEKGNKIPESPAREENYSYFFKLASQEEKLFEIEKFEKYLFDETHTYTKEMFQEKFVAVMEEKEVSAG